MVSRTRLAGTLVPCRAPGMLMESFVAVLALIAACALTPGVYFAINAPAGAIGTTAASAADAVRPMGLHLSLSARCRRLRRRWVRVATVAHRRRAESRARHGAALRRRLGGTAAMATLVSLRHHVRGAVHSHHARRRHARRPFMLQDLGGNLGALWRVSWYPAVVMSSAIFVAMWGHFLYQGVIDPLGGINSLWPLFGISNQLLATVALCVATTVIIKMGKADSRVTMCRSRGSAS